MMSGFSVPVVMFIYKRKDTCLKIIDRIREVKPVRMYLLADAGRNPEEDKLVQECRGAVEAAIDWDCQLIKNYADVNRGVHAQIGLGALWVFEQEPVAIFLEDDNLPEVSFFEYCWKCLKKYEHEDKIVWICGTNYLEKCTPAEGASVLASRHLMPCGWASWAGKFTKYYDADLRLAEGPDWERKLKLGYRDKRLYVQQVRSIRSEVKKKNLNERYRSWDYHLVLSMRMRGLYGIVPCSNQITNIGVDDFSTHGGNSWNSKMTQRFCSIRSYPLPEHLGLPVVSALDFSFERKIGNIILYPYKERVIMYLREKLNVADGVRLRSALMGWVR